MVRSSHRISIRETLYLNVMLLIAFIAQVWAYYVCYRQSSDFYPFYFTAFLSTIAMILFTIWRGKNKADTQTHVMSCILVGFLWGLGCLIALLSNTFHYIFARKFKENFSDWLFNYLFASDAKEKSADKLYHRIISGLEDQEVLIDTEPLVDVMDFGSLEQKQAALIKVVKYFRPHLAPVLKMGINDSNNAIRVQAAAGLARLQDDFHKKYTVYEQKIDNQNMSQEELIRFAELCENYATAKILDPEQKEEALNRSIMLYEKSITLSSDNIELKISLIGVLLIKGDMERAQSLLSEILPQVRKPTAEVADTLLELLFKMDRFKEMRHYAAIWCPSDGHGVVAPTEERIAIWSGKMDEQHMEITNR